MLHSGSTNEELQLQLTKNELLADYYRLQESKMTFLLNTTQEIERLQKYLNKLAPSPSANNSSSSASGSNPSSAAAAAASLAINYSESIDSTSDLSDIKAALVRLQQSKLDLVTTMSAEIDQLRTEISHHSKPTGTGPSAGTLTSLKNWFFGSAPDATLPNSTTSTTKLTSATSATSVAKSQTSKTSIATTSKSKGFKSRALAAAATGATHVKSGARTGAVTAASAAATAANTVATGTKLVVDEGAQQVGGVVGSLGFVAPYHATLSGIKKEMEFDAICELSEGLEQFVRTRVNPKNEQLLQPKDAKTWPALLQSAREVKGSFTKFGADVVEAVKDQVEAKHEMETGGWIDENDPNSIGATSGGDDVKQEEQRIEIVVPQLKGEARARQKVETKYTHLGEDKYRRLFDVCRMALVHEDMSDLEVVLNILLHGSESSDDGCVFGWEICDFSNRYENPTIDGWADMQMLIRPKSQHRLNTMNAKNAMNGMNGLLNDTHVCEVQVIHRKMWEHRQRGKFLSGHGRYEFNRNVEATANKMDRVVGMGTGIGPAKAAVRSYKIGKNAVNNKMFGL